MVYSTNLNLLRVVDPLDKLLEALVPLSRCLPRKNQRRYNTGLFPEETR